MSDDIVQITFKPGDTIASESGSATAMVSGQFEVDYTSGTIVESDVTINDGTAHKVDIDTLGQGYGSTASQPVYVADNSASTDPYSAELEWIGNVPSEVDVLFFDTNGAIYSSDVAVKSANVVCFAAGTSIRTVAGDVAVETLETGDLVVTASSQHRPIRWLGHRTIDCRRMADRAAVLPVRIAAHAFGPGKPARHLYVSPGHAICVAAFDEVLIPAGVLVNGATVAQVDMDEVTYWHVELESHDVLLANGLPAESFIDVGNRAFFLESRTVDLRLGPDAPAKTLDDYCLPFFDGGPLVDAVRERMRHRALALGWSQGGDALGGLHLMADGVRIEPDASGLAVRFVVPASARDVWLVSDASVPRDLGIGEDRRMLGVCLGALAIDDGLDVRRAVDLDDPRLGAGFHDVEAGSMRWTDGRARLSTDIWAGARGTFFLRIDLAMASPARWVGPVSNDTDVRVVA